MGRLDNRERVVFEVFMLSVKNIIKWLLFKLLDLLIENEVLGYNGGILIT